MRFAGNGSPPKVSPIPPLPPARWAGCAGCADRNWRVSRAISAAVGGRVAAAAVGATTVSAATIAVVNAWRITRVNNLRRPQERSCGRASDARVSAQAGARSRRMRRRIFPDGDFGISSTSSTRRIFFCGET